MTYDVYQGSNVVGTVEGDENGYKVDSSDQELHIAIEIALEHPATVMSGGEDENGFYDAAREFKPGEKGHFDAVMTGGTLVRYGYVGVARD